MTATGQTGEGKKAQVGLPNQAKDWPTIKATDGPNGGPNQRNGSKGDMALPSVAAHWPTATAADGKRNSLTQPRGNNTLLGEASSWQTPAPFQGKYRRQANQTERTEKLLPAQAEDSGETWPGHPAPRSEMPGWLFSSETGDSPPPCRLNPTFVEWLMGTPLNWSNPSCKIGRTDFEAWATQSFLNVQHSLGLFYGDVPPRP